MAGQSGLWPQKTPKKAQHSVAPPGRALLRERYAALRAEL